MKVQLVKKGQSTFFHHYCKCGEYAPFGKGVDLTMFLDKHSKGIKDYSLLGTWTCGIDGCKTQRELF